MFNEKDTFNTPLLLFLRKYKAWILFILGFAFAFLAYTVGVAAVFLGLAYLFNCDPIYQTISSCDKKAPFPFIWNIYITVILLPIAVFLFGRKKFFPFVIGFLVAVALMLLNVILQEAFGSADFLGPLFELFDT